MRQRAGSFQVVPTRPVNPALYLFVITMAYVKIKINDVASPDDLTRWEDRMLEKAKCWNKFCLGLYSEHELRAVHVVKEDNEDTFLTTLCEDCIKTTADYGVLVNEKHLILDLQRE